MEKVQKFFADHWIKILVVAVILYALWKWHESQEAKKKAAASTPATAPTKSTESSNYITDKELIKSVNQRQWKCYGRTLDGVCLGDLQPVK